MTSPGLVDAFVVSVCEGDVRLAPKLVIYGVYGTHYNQFVECG